ncbi:MAG TPA: alginate lyase family protein [Nitrospiraceae bacterium]|nr:alginate lyase family protein [Nitrospiraceae bacterium]
MSRESTVTWRELVQAKVRTAGPAGVMRIAMAKMIRPVVIRWRCWQDRRRPAATGSCTLIRALQIDEQKLAERVADIRRGLTSRLPTGPADTQTLRLLYQQRAPEELQSCVSAADRLCDHVFDLLGSGPTDLGKNIDWHRDFKSGFRWEPSDHYLAVRHGAEPGVDIKVPWELSRCQHLPVLAQAYVLTGACRYAQEVVDQISDWIAENPTGRGVNWACPMEVAIRAVNWLWAIGLIADAPAVTGTWLVDVLASLIGHGRHVAANLERRTDGVTTNHYLADLVGLLYLGLCLPECRDSGRWRAIAVRELTQEMDRQVLDDGVHYESSISYHRLVSEMFLSAALLCRHHGISLPDPFHRKLHLMCEFTRGYTKPNGLAPQVGDGDNGRLHILTGYGTVDHRDHRHVLAAGAALYGPEDWWRAAGPRKIEALWLGKQGRDLFSRQSDMAVTAQTSVAFPSGGFYIMRDREDYVLFNCNPVGTKGLGTHKHNDILSLELHLGGEDILVDPGCFLYTGDPRMYDLFRGTAHHSTVMIDGREQNRFIAGRFFCLHPDGRPRTLKWETGDELDCVAAEFDGYRRLSDSICHRREVSVHRPGPFVHVVDHFSGLIGRSTAHCIEWAWTCAPGCRVVRAENGWDILTSRQVVRLTNPLRHPRVAGCAEIESRVEEAPVASSYGTVQNASWLRWRWKGVLPVSVTFMILKPTDRSL